MPLRVLVVEDSVTVRRHICGVLAADPAIEVVGEAGDGRDAIHLTETLRPDVVTMDMMLPVMTGLGATEYIMAHCPTPILIVSSSLNRGEVFKTCEALAAGAVDVLEKPTGNEAEGVWEAAFVRAVKLVARVRPVTHPRARLGPLGVPRSLPAAERIDPVASPVRPACEVVAIGASTGGPGALLQILRSIPADCRVPLLIVMHLGEPFARSFAEWLDAQTLLRVVYAGDAQPVVAGRVTLAPPGSHLSIRGGRTTLTRDAERHSCRPSVDVLFESVAVEYGAAAVGCLLTGMGRDGAAGLLEIRRAGGLTIAQDEATSVVYGMPREAASLGAAERVLPLSAIGPTIAGLIS